jgi:hypothetical protein
MKHATYTRHCLELTERLLFDQDVDVRKAVSFAIRTCARTDPQLVCVFLEKQVAAANSAAVWVLCDVIKSLDRRLIGEFAPLLPYYRKWGTAPEVSSKDKRSIESAIRVLEAS